MHPEASSLNRLRSGMIILAVAVPFVAGCSRLGSQFEALLLLQHLVPHTGSSWLVKMSEPPKRSIIRWEDGGIRYHGDLYEPGEKPVARLLLIPGVAEEGKDDPRLIAFASALA